VTPDWEQYMAPPTARIEKAMALRRSKLPPEQGKAFAAGVQKQLEFLKLVHDRGGILVTGTDPGAKNLIPGFGVHRELRLLVRAGLTPLAAVRAATQHAAWSLGVDRDLGTIEAGKIADVVLVDGDPSAQIADVGRTFAVWQAGRRHDPVELRKQAEGKIK
jgi:imidazolonepropionase-like amidohydrolase